MLRSAAASAMMVALALTMVACLTDVPLLAVEHQSARYVLATAAADVALAFFCALAAAPLWTLIVSALRAIRRNRALHRLWLLPVVIVGFATSLLLTDALYRPHTTPYVICAGGFGVALAAQALVARMDAGRARLLLLGAIGGAALAADLFLSQAVGREVRDVIALIAASAALTALEPLRLRVAAADGRKLALTLTLGLAASLVVVYAVDPLAPGWRPQAWQLARWQPRLGHALRALVDLDGDGFSPVAWGGDCDDRDPGRNPVRRDHDGIDANCNGTVRPAHPTDADRGLAPPSGDPDEPAGAVDRVVFITIDTFRADVFTSAVTPRLRALASEGIDLTRLYSAASSTLLSMTLVLRGADDAPPAAERLLERGVHTTALFAYHDPRLQAAFFPGFAESHAPTENEVRWSARELTDRAISHLRAAPRSRRELLWLHYFDAHYPVTPAPDLPPVAAPPGRSAEMGRYLTALATIDREIGRLQDWLIAGGLWQRTLVVVTADHGESFGEHGIGYHGVGTYEAVVHVPGILVGPNVKPERYQHVVTHRDLPATLLGAFALVVRDPSVEEFGRSWLRLVGVPGAPLHRFVVTRSDRAESSIDARRMPMAAVVDDDAKLMVTFAIDLRELYRPLADPGERDDLFASSASSPSVSEAARRLSSELALYCDIDGYP